MRLTIKDRQKIIDCYKADKTVSIIAQEMEINSKTVCYWIKRYKNKESLETKKGQGRKKKYSDDTVNLIIKLMKENKKYKITHLKHKLMQHNISLSRSTLKYILKTYGYTYGNGIKKQVLTNTHKRMRFIYAYYNLSTDWTNIIFSDETSIVKDKYTNGAWYGPNDNKIMQTFKHPIKRHVWACMTLGGVGTIFVFKQIMNAQFYVKILTDYLLPIYDQSYTFQQDNDPKHTAKITYKFFIDNNIKLLTWPANSPDLNPIENHWVLLKNKLSYLDINEDNFDDHIIQSWKAINYEHTYNTISSLHCRIADVINNDGGHIKY